MNDRTFRIAPFAIVFWVVAVMALAPSLGRSALAKDSSTSEAQSPTQKENWAMLVGKWFGEVEIDGGGKQKWIVERYKNGTYQIHFRVFTKDGQVRDQVEAGHWGVSGPVYFSINRATRAIDGNFRETDPANPRFYDAYEVIELTHHLFRYKHFDKGIEFEVKKVDDDFELPLRSDFN